MLSHRYCTVVAVAGLIFGALPLLRAEDAPKEEPKKMPAAKAGDMHSEMEAMNKAIRTLNKTIADASKKDASLAAVYDLQLHTVACKKEIPKTAATQPGDKKEAFIAGFRKGM